MIEGVTCSHACVRVCLRECNCKRGFICVLCIVYCLCVYVFVCEGHRENLCMRACV